MRERIRKTLIVPDLVGLNQEDAQIMLANSGFGRAKVRFVESYDELDSVVQQSPMKGQAIDSSTPIHIHVAKQSYVRFLPQIYQTESAVGSSFLKEYLWIFQHSVESITSQIDNAHKYYDPRETPPEFLPWLASWLALTLDVDWPEIKKRKMLQAAANMYRYRGTKRALKEVLRIFVGQEPRILENTWPYKGFRIGISSAIAEDSLILPPINLDHCFVVRFPIGQEQVTEGMVIKIHHIIAMEKPGHTTYFLQFHSEDLVHRPQAFMQIGVAATIGVTEYTKEISPEDSADDSVERSASK